MNPAMKIEEVDLDATSAEYLWQNSSVKAKMLWSMLNGVSFNILKLTDKSWNELPVQYQKELIEAWTRKS